MFLLEIYVTGIEIPRMQSRIKQLKQELADILQKTGSAAQNNVKPELAHLIKKKKAELKVAQDELAHAIKKPEIEKNIRRAQGEIVQAQGEITPEVKKQMFSASISKGFDTWAKLRTKFENDAGINKAIEAVAKKQTEQGKYDLDVEQLAKHFDVPTRSMYKRLEDPILFNVSSLMPKNRK